MLVCFLLTTYRCYELALTTHTNFYQGLIQLRTCTFVNYYSFYESGQPMSIISGAVAGKPKTVAELFERFDSAYQEQVRLSSDVS